ncbi:hypothetical protein C1H46_004557 [Malus baccata]|uniref:Uncharacterized protein n=1 Tax=Malus baccata TaxID=106549 RepID=A0A540NGP1_MALBA|nr:hypothetical protein C1H46_004557 [Malus baccata]
MQPALSDSVGPSQIPEPSGQALGWRRFSALWTLRLEMALGSPQNGSEENPVPKTYPLLTFLAASFNSTCKYFHPDRIFSSATTFENSTRDFFYFILFFENPSFVFL